MRAASLAARWMEMALQVNPVEALLARYSPFQQRHWSRLYKETSQAAVEIGRKTAGTVEVTPMAGQIARILLTAFGSYGAHCRTTLLSMLTHTTVPLSIFVAGDAAGVADVRRALDEDVGTEGLKSGSISRLEMMDLTRHARFQAALRRLPHEFRERGVYSDLSDWARLFAETYMPRSVDRLIYMDTGDVLVLGDIAEMWSIFEEFNDEQFFGAAGMTFQLEGYRPLQRRLNTTFVAGGRGLQSGVLLLHLARARAANFTSELLGSLRELAGRLPGEELHRIRLMDVMNFHFGRTPRRFFRLPCAWNYMPKPTGYDAVWASPNMWPASVWNSMISHPGLLSFHSFEHHCPSSAELFAAQTQDIQNEVLLPIAGVRGAQTRFCRCGDRVKLLHAAGAIKVQPWVSHLLMAWGIPMASNAPTLLSWNEYAR